MKVYDDYLRWLYRGGRPSWFARLQNRVSAVAFAAGIWPARVGALEVRGRRSGRVISFPVVIADYKGDRYLVSMLGERANWVGNVRAANGRAVLRHGPHEEVCLEEVPVGDRARSCAVTWRSRPGRGHTSRSTGPLRWRTSSGSPRPSPSSTSRPPSQPTNPRSDRASERG